MEAEKNQYEQKLQAEKTAKENEQAKIKAEIE